MKIVASASFLLLAALVQAQFDPAKFPPGDKVPPTNSPEMLAWLKDLDFSDVPKFTPNTPMTPGGPPTCQPKDPIPQDRCWWTCQMCPATDVEDCPSPNDWGLTFDDGPTPSTIPLLAFLKQSNLKATFFVMGTNVVKNPEILKQELAEGHHLASHTWSHHALTTLTNEQIVAEVKWAEKAVEDITGMKMKYIRPPYGDIDARVRAVVAKLGYTVVDWSRAYDTLDYNLKASPQLLGQHVTDFTTKLESYAANPGAKGIISLQHDLYDVTTQYAREMLTAVAAKPNVKLNIKTVAQCLGDANGYQGGVPPVTPTPSGKPSGGTGGSPSGAPGTNPTDTKGPKGAAGTVEFSFMTAGAAVIVALAGSMGMFL